MTSLIKFTHKPTNFPAFLSYLTTNLLGEDGNPLIKDSTIDGRDLSCHLKDSSYSKKNLFVSGITRQLAGDRQKIPFGKDVKKNLVVFNDSAICPNSRYFIQSGEMWIRHGQLHLNIKFQQRNKYGIINCLIIPAVDIHDPSVDIPDPAVDIPDPVVNPPPAVDIPGPAFNPSYPPPKWKVENEHCQSILMKKAAKFGLRLLKETDHMPEALKRQILNFGMLVLIRPGDNTIDPDNPASDSVKFSLGVDPNMGTFLVCHCPWTGDEFWVGFDVGEHIGDLLDKITAIESEIGTEANKSPEVKRQEDVVIRCAVEFINATQANRKRTYRAKMEAESSLLSLKADIAKRLREAFYQSELDELRGKIYHLQTKLHNIASQFLSPWSIIAIPRFDLKNIVKCGKANELGDKQKAILAYLAHCKFLTRLRTSVAKHGNDIVEVTECGSTKNCSKCNSKNSPRFDRYYHCRHCKSKLTRDGNAAKNIFKMALAAILIYLSDGYPLWKYLHKDDDDDSDVGSENELDVEGDWVMDGDWLMGEVDEFEEDKMDEMEGYGDKDDEAGGESGAGKSRVVGSDNKKDLGPLLSSNVLSNGLTRLARRSGAVDSKLVKQGSQSIQ